MPPPNMPTGRIKFISSDRSHGYIAADTGDEFLFQRDAVAPDVLQGDIVTFSVLPRREGQRLPTAVNVHRRSLNLRPVAATRIDASDSESKIARAKEAGALARQAQEARGHKEFDKARTLFERALEKVESYDFYLSYASMERELAEGGYFDRAARVYERALKAYPNTGKIYEDYGMLYLRSLPQRAIEFFRTGIQKDPSHKILHKYLGSALFATNDPAAYAAAEQELLIAKKDGLLDRQAELQLSMLRVLRGNPRGKQLMTFFAKVGFDILSIPSHAPTHHADFVIRVSRPEYVESYDMGSDLLVRCFYKHQLTIPDIRDFLTYFSSLASEHDTINRDVALIAANNVLGIRDYLYKLIEQAGRYPTIVPLDDLLVSRTTGTPNADEVLRPHLDDWLYKRNLYEDNFPVSGRRFFGREQELSNLMRSVDAGQPVGLFGLRKVGKTSLLKRLQEKRLQDLVVYIDIQSVPEGVRDAGYIYWAIANQLAEEVRRKYPEFSNTLAFRLAGRYKAYLDVKKTELVAAEFDADLKVLTAEARRQKLALNVLIMFDEVERLLPIGRSEGIRGYDSLFAYLRGISQTEENVLSIITGANPFISDTPQFEGRDNPVFKYYKEVFLPPLERRECLEMIERLGHGMGVTYNDNGLDRIFKETAGHPFITRQLCSRIAKVFKERPLKVDVPKVEKGVQEFLFNDADLFKEIMERLGRDFPREKDILLAIASGILDATALERRVIDAREALRHLLGYELVEHKDGCYRIKMNLFATWISKYWLDEKTTTKPV